MDTLFPFKRYSRVPPQLLRTRSELRWGSDWFGKHVQGKFLSEQQQAAEEFLLWLRRTNGLLSNDSLYLGVPQTASPLFPYLGTHNAGVIALE